MKIKYLTGNDVREPIEPDCKNLIVHCCNDLGLMGAGVAKALFDKWPNVRSEYLRYFEKGTKNKLGDTQSIKVESNTYVVNLIGQHGIHEDENGDPPVRYWAISKGFKTLSKKIIDYNDSSKKNVVVNIPYLMGCDLAGGKWEEIEYLINEHFIGNNIEVHVHDLFGKRNS